MPKQPENDDNKKPSTHPEPIGINLKACALTISTVCGQCHHFERMAHPTYVKPCKALGILDVAKPCTRFTPDPRALKMHSDEFIQMLAQVLHEIPTNKLPLMASLINREARTRRRKFCFGEVVYLRVLGGDYVSNYRRARVIWAEKDYIHIEGNKFIASVLYSTILNAKEWKKKKAALLADNKKRDPNYKRNFEIHTPAEKLFAQSIDNPLPSIAYSHKNSKVFVADDATTIKIKGKKVKAFNKFNDLRTTPLDVLIVTDTIKTRG